MYKMIFRFNVKCNIPYIFLISTCYRSNIFFINFSSLLSRLIYPPIETCKQKIKQYEIYKKKSIFEFKMKIHSYFTTTEQVQRGFIQKIVLKSSKTVTLLGWKAVAVHPPVHTDRWSGTLPDATTPYNANLYYLDGLSIYVLYLYYSVFTVTSIFRVSFDIFPCTRCFRML